jgi:hypothetical protein
MSIARRPMGTCCKCGYGIEIGESYTHSRHESGKRMHSKCRVRTDESTERIISAPATPPATTPHKWDAKEPEPLDLSGGFDEIGDRSAPMLELHKTLGRLLSVPDSPAPAPVTAPVPAPKPRGKLRIGNEWYARLEALLNAGASRVLLVGPPGTGKSTTAADGHKFRITCHEDMGPESLVGTFIQKNGETIWVDGPAVRAMRLGSRLILDEIDHTSPECMSILYALLDDKPAIMLPTGEYIEAQDGYSVIATTNGNPSDLPEPILDRIEAVILADRPHNKAVDRVREIAAGRPELVAVLQNHYRNESASQWTWRGVPSLRRVLAFARFTGAGIPDNIAAEAVWGDAGREVLSVLATADKDGTR